MKSKPEFKQSRNWCFTDFEIRDIEGIFYKYDDIIRYVCFGQETCPKTKRKHQQGWIQFVNKKTLGGVKRIFASRQIHLEPCYGSESENDKYCQKDNRYTCLGQYVLQGQRTDLEDIKKRLDNQDSMYSISNAHFGDFLRYHSGLYKYAQLVAKERTKKFRNVEVIFYSGKTGTGKTITAMREATFKIEGDSLDWWDGYENDKIICIDEYSNQIPVTRLLNILDGYQLRLPIKGGFTYANWNKIYVTTNLTKEELHPFAKDEHQRALIRRIKTFAEVTKGNTNFSHDMDTRADFPPHSGGWEKVYAPV